jgi:hypothetical protein
MPSGGDVVGLIASAQSSILSSKAYAYLTGSGARYQSVLDFKAISDTILWYATIANVVLVTTFLALCAATSRRLFRSSDALLWMVITPIVLFIAALTISLASSYGCAAHPNGGNAGTIFPRPNCRVFGPLL